MAACREERGRPETVSTTQTEKRGRAQWQQQPRQQCISTGVTCIEHCDAVVFVLSVCRLPLSGRASAAAWSEAAAASSDTRTTRGLLPTASLTL